MAVNKEQVRNLLGAGLNNSVVAAAVGCEPSYITELLLDENFREEVMSLRLKNLTAQAERDKNIDGIEDELIEKLKIAVDTNGFYKPNEILRAFHILNQAKRKATPAHESVVINQQIVNLVIPPVVIQKFLTSNTGEVIEIEGQTLITKSSTELLKELAQGGRDDSEQFEKALRYLPPAIEEGTVSENSAFSPKDSNPFRKSNRTKENIRQHNAQATIDATSRRIEDNI